MFLIACDFSGGGITTGSNVSVTDVSISKTNAIIYRGGTLQLSVTVEPAGATNKEVQWLSSDTTIATVNKTGLVTMNSQINTETAYILVISKDGDFFDICTVRQYKLRDRGPAGGLICYINPNFATNGWTYLAAAPKSTEWITIAYGGYGTLTGADRTAIGTGEQNTIDIVATYGDNEPHQNLTNYAAKLCCDLYVINNGVTYDNWFLPSMDEQNKMYVNLTSGIDENNITYKPVGDFQHGFHWNSSEYTADGGRTQCFGSGEQSGDWKYHDGYNVRAARYF